METETLRRDYEAKLADMKSSYEAELMSKQKLQEAMERLQNDYNRKVHNVEEQYGSTTTVTAPGGVGMGDEPADSAISMIALANELVSKLRQQNKQTCKQSFLHSNTQNTLVSTCRI